jgi:hypothetical protein
LILILLEDFPMDLLAFFWGIGVAAALCLPVWVFEALAPAPADRSLADSPPEDWFETRKARIWRSSLNPEIGEMKLSKVYIQTKKLWDLKKAKK